MDYDSIEIEMFGKWTLNNGIALYGAVKTIDDNDKLIDINSFIFIHEKQKKITNESHRSVTTNKVCCLPRYSHYISGLLVICFVVPFFIPFLCCVRCRSIIYFSCFVFFSQFFRNVVIVSDIPHMDDFSNISSKFDACKESM